MGLAYIVCTLVLTVYGQLAIKHQVNLAGSLPATLDMKIEYIVKLLLNPWVISGFIGAFLAAVSWMMALSQFPLSYAYPFMSLSFVLIPFFSAFFFKEVIQMPQVVGLFFIVLGVVIGSKR